MSTPPRVLATLSAYASEGGFDGRYQPATCFTPSISLGRHPGSGVGDGLWDEYEAVLNLAAAEGLAGVCLEISWARLEPRRGQRDEVALARYARAIAHAQGLGLHVGLAAIDGAWPAWLGLEAWLLPWVVAVAVEHVVWIASSLPGDSVSVFAAREHLTRGFLDAGAGPPWRRGAKEDAQSAERNLDEIEARSREASPVALVTSAAIELDELDDAVSGVDEVHVRSLLRGSGPLRSEHGLLARRGDRWVLVGDVPQGLLRRA